MRAESLEGADERAEDDESDSAEEHPVAGEMEQKPNIIPDGIGLGSGSSRGRLLNSFRAHAVPE